MKVTINSNSDFSNQGENMVGTIISDDSAIHPCSSNPDDDENCEWVGVKWPNGYKNLYRICPY